MHLKRINHSCKRANRPVIDALNQTSSYIYNIAGQLSQNTDRKGQNTSYSYDLAGRMIGMTEADGTTSSYTYDVAGRLTQKRHNLQTSTYSYDDGDRLISESTQTAAGTTTLAYTYDNANRPIQRKITFVGTGDPATTPAAPVQTTTYQWNKASQIARIALSVGTTSATNPELVSTYTYDAAGRLSSKTLPAAANTPANAQNVVQGITQTYTFDVADRLSQIKYAKSDGTVIDQIDYTYDAAGQRISKTMLNGSSAPETPMSATFDAGNRMQTITLNPSKPEQKIYTLTYDNNGNLTKKQLSTDTNCSTDCTEYVWDARNRLTQIKQNQTTSATYSYDAENRRIQTNITTNGQSGITNQVSYIYAGSQSVGEVRNQQLSHSLMTGLQMDEHIARIALNQAGAEVTPQVKTYLTDALRSVIATARADQSLEVGYAYSPYGQTQKVGVENQIAGGWNRYAYVDGAPTMFTDPTGEFAFIPILIGMGVGYAFDYALEQYKKEHYTCKDTPAGSTVNTVVGGVVGGSGPFASKPRGGIAGGGPAGSATSSFSQMNHAAKRSGWYSTATQHRITKVLRRLPYAGAAFAGYEIYDTFSCD
jgi:YD repeat-containing protein